VRHRLEICCSCVKGPATRAANPSRAPVSGFPMVARTVWPASLEQAAQLAPNQPAFPTMATQQEATSRSVLCQSDNTVLPPFSSTLKRSPDGSRVPKFRRGKNHKSAHAKAARKPCGRRITVGSVRCRQRQFTRA